MDLPGVPDLQDDEKGPVFLEMLDEEGNNYFSWLAGMEVYMDYLEVSQVAKGNELAPSSLVGEDTTRFLEWGRKDRLAKAQIARNVPISLLSQFDRTSSATLLAGLNERFTFDKDIRQMVAYHQLKNNTIGINERMSTHISELRKLRSAFLLLGGELSDSDWRGTILCSLCHDWILRIALLRTEDKHSPESLIHALLQAEAHLNLVNGTIATGDPDNKKTVSTTSNFQEPFMVKNSTSRRFRCDNCNIRGHSRLSCYYPGGGQVGNAPASWVPRRDILARTSHAH